MTTPDTLAKLAAEFKDILSTYGITSGMAANELAHRALTAQAPAPKLSEKLITLLKCLPEAPFKEHLKAEIEALAAQAPFTGIAARKLADLADQGYRVNGYSLMHSETRARGFIDHGGFVGWWSNRDHEQAAQAPAVPDAAMLQHAYRRGFLRCAGWAQRDDLFADAGSPTYLKDQAHDLLQVAAASLPQPPQPQSAQPGSQE